MCTPYCLSVTAVTNHVFSLHPLTNSAGAFPDSWFRLPTSSKHDMDGSAGERQAATASSTSKDWNRGL